MSCHRLLYCAAITAVATEISATLAAIVWGTTAMGDGGGGAIAASAVRGSVLGVLLFYTLRRRHWAWLALVLFESFTALIGGVLTMVLMAQASHGRIRHTGAVLMICLIYAFFSVLVGIGLNPKRSHK